MHFLLWCGTFCDAVDQDRGNLNPVATCWVYRGGWPGILTFGVGWGGVGMITFLALAHISILRN